MMADHAFIYEISQMQRDALQEMIAAAEEYSGFALRDRATETIRLNLALARLKLMFAVESE